jgi:hypothetical protein
MTAEVTNPCFEANKAKLAYSATMYFLKYQVQMWHDDILTLWRMSI